MKARRRTTAEEFARFSLVGAAGFVVDAAVLNVLLAWSGLGLYSGRVCSYLAAATFTWALNRAFTFRGADRARPGAQWGKFLSANALGAAVNYGAYALLVATLSNVAARPVLGVAAGSIAGLAFNFAASKFWVFKR
jgi:putative flippase GtrA